MVGRVGPTVWFAVAIPILIYVVCNIRVSVPGIDSADARNVVFGVRWRLRLLAHRFFPD